MDEKLDTFSIHYIQPELHVKIKYSPFISIGEGLKIFFTV